LTPADISRILSQSTIPEHSVAFMAAMSGGEPFLVGDYLFIGAEDWLLAVGYPLEGVLQSGAVRGGAGRSPAPDPRPGLLGHLPRTPRAAESLPPGAGSLLRSFSRRPHTTAPGALGEAGGGRAHGGGGHQPSRRPTAACGPSSWAARPCPRTFASSTPAPRPCFGVAPGLSLLNAWDRDGRLAACLLLDAAPAALHELPARRPLPRPLHPYASDLLFREMIRIARKSGKEFLHLGSA
jgi:hypothetical protein